MMPKVLHKCLRDLAITWRDYALIARPWFDRFHLSILLISTILIVLGTFVIVTGYGASPSQHLYADEIGLIPFTVALLVASRWLLAVERTRAELPRSYASCANLTFSMLLIASKLLVSGYAGICAAEHAERTVSDRTTLLRDAATVGMLIEIDGQPWIDYPYIIHHSSLQEDQIICSAMVRDPIEFGRVIVRYSSPTRQINLRMRTPAILETCNSNKNLSEHGFVLMVNDAWTRLIELAIAHNMHRSLQPISHQSMIVVLALVGALLGGVVLALLASVGFQVAFGSAFIMLAASIALDSIVPLSANTRLMCYSVISTWCSPAAAIGLIIFICLQRLRARRSIYSDVTVAFMLWLPVLACWRLLSSKSIIMNSHLGFSPWTVWQGLPVPAEVDYRICFCISIGFLLFSPLLGWLLEIYRRLPSAR